MIHRLNYFFIFLILILPLTLITGPAIPDLTVTFSIIFFLFSIFIHKSYKHIYKNIFVKFSIIYWLFFLFISLFAENVLLAYRDSTIFVRYLALPIFLIFLIFDNNKLLVSYDKNITQLKEIIEILNKNNISFYEINTYESDLEDVFINLIKNHDT